MSHVNFWIKNVPGRGDYRYEDPKQKSSCFAEELEASGWKEMTSEMMGGYGCCWPFLPFPLSESQFWAWKWFERTSVVTDLLWASFVFRVKVGVAVYLCLNSHRGREWVPSWENPQQLYRLNCQGNLLSHSVPTGQRLAYYCLQAKSAPTSFYKWRLNETKPCLSVDVFSMATFVLWWQSWVAATEII